MIYIVKVQDDENEVDDVNQMLVGEDALPH